MSNNIIEIGNVEINRADDRINLGNINIDNNRINLENIDIPLIQGKQGNPRLYSDCWRRLLYRRRKRNINK